jgi:hypothetical protein
MSKPRGQSLTQTVTIDDAKLFQLLIINNNNNNKASLMSLHVFLTLQIPITSLTLAPVIRGPNDDVMETHESVVLPLLLGQHMTFRLSLSNSS